MRVKSLTLSSVRSILQSKHPPALQRRKENVRRPLQELNLWEDLAPETEAMIIATLFKLISKVVYPKTQEDNHDR
jgi:hypothetical protein